MNILKRKYCQPYLAEITFNHHLLLGHSQYVVLKLDQCIPFLPFPPINIVDGSFEMCLPDTKNEPAGTDKVQCLESPETFLVTITDIQKMGPCDPGEGYKGRITRYKLTVTPSNTPPICTIIIFEDSDGCDVCHQFTDPDC